MSDQIRDALTIAVVGVAVVMVALFVLMIAIMFLTRLAPGKKDHEEQEMSGVKLGHDRDKGEVAAIAVALALAMKEKVDASTDGDEQPVAPGHAVSRWASAGREQLMRSRRPPEHRWGRPSARQ